MKEMILDILEVISYHGILCGEQKASHERVCMLLSFVEDLGALFLMNHHACHEL
jgi:hypothetical protein